MNDFYIVLGGMRITPSLNVKYLGTILDAKLSWKDHIEKKCIKSNDHNGAKASLKTYLGAEQADNRAPSF